MTNYDELVKRLRAPKSWTAAYGPSAATQVFDAEARFMQTPFESASAIEGLQRQLAEKDEALREVVELQFRCYTAVLVLKTMLKRAKLGGGANVAADLLTDLAKANPEFPARSSLRAAIVAKHEGEKG